MLYKALLCTFNYQFSWIILIWNVTYVTLFWYLGGFDNGVWKNGVGDLCTQKRGGSCVSGPISEVLENCSLHSEI